MSEEKVLKYLIRIAIWPVFFMIFLMAFLAYALEGDHQSASKAAKLALTGWMDERGA